ncbi:MAG: hypothetical protein ACR2JC_18445 [Chloroflexota bacterium]
MEDQIQAALSDVLQAAATARDVVLFEEVRITTHDDGSLRLVYWPSNAASEPYTLRPYQKQEPPP